MLERDPEVKNSLDRIAYSLLRSIRLARTEYLHALGVIAALIIIYLVLGIGLGIALVGFADNGRSSPSPSCRSSWRRSSSSGSRVLYFEQRARAAVSSPPEAA